MGEFYSKCLQIGVQILGRDVRAYESKGQSRPDKIQILWGPRGVGCEDENSVDSTKRNIVTRQGIDFIEDV